jgi:hypothetical protein
MSDKVMVMTGDDGEEISLKAIEQTMISNILYILAEENETDNVYIMKEVRSEGEDSWFEFVEDDEEWNAIMPVFEELLGEDYTFEYGEKL